MKKFILFIISIVICFTNYYELEIENVDINFLYPYEIIISKINLEQNIYSYNESDVDHNIIYLKESDFNKDFYILAAHSGNSDISYFKDINLLKNGDEIALRINNKIINYYVEDIYFVKKNGSITIQKNDNTLYLTTCDKDNNKRQLVIKCVKKCK